MPRANRPCRTPSCPEIATRRGLCVACTRTTEKQRGSSTRRGYGATWRNIRARYLKAHPFCETPGCHTPATDVHHLDGRGPRGNNNTSNLQALCHSHHSSITARESALGREGR